MALTDPSTGQHYVNWPARNGLGLSSVILGTLGVIFGVTLVGFFFALVLGVIGVALGLVGRARAIRGEATNPRQATWGVTLSIVALGLSLIGPIFVLGKIGQSLQDTFNKTSTTINNNTPGPSGQVSQKFIDCVTQIDSNDPDYLAKYKACSDQ